MSRLKPLRGAEVGLDTLIGSEKPGRCDRRLILITVTCFDGLGRF
jgi:hypothetical protein